MSFVSFVDRHGRLKPADVRQVQVARERATSRRAAIKWRKRNDETNRRWVDEYKARLGCKECPERDPVCLDLHHRDPSTKVAPVSSLMGSRLSVVIAEVEKCDVICANCHRKLHHHARQVSV